MSDKRDLAADIATVISAKRWGYVDTALAEHAIRRAMAAEDWQRRAVEVLLRCCVSSRRGTVCVICGQLIKDIENPVHAPDCAIAALLREVRK